MFVSLDICMMKSLFSSFLSQKTSELPNRNQTRVSRLCVCVCVCVCVHIYMYVCVCVDVYIYVYL